MNPSPPIRKIFFGCADRRQMFRLFDRNAQRPDRWPGDPSGHYAGEWFEIVEAEYEYMLDILPPLWMRGGMFAMRECLTGSVTSVFFALRIDGRDRWFHGYCDLKDKRTPDLLRAAIIERESRPVRAMTRQERLDHIWSETHDEYRGYAGEDWPIESRGRRFVICFAANGACTQKLLDKLNEAEISAKLPVQLRYLPELLAA